MEEMLGYAIFNIKVTNPEDYKQYLQQVTSIAEQFGGKYIVRGGESTVIEWFDNLPDKLKKKLQSLES